MDGIELRLVELFRNRVRARGFTPMSAHEAEAAVQAYRRGEDNNRIEGLHATPGDRAFVSMLLQERIPSEHWTRLGAEFARALIAARAGQLAA